MARVHKKNRGEFNKNKNKNLIEKNRVVKFLISVIYITTVQKSYFYRQNFKDKIQDLYIFFLVRIDMNLYYNVD